MNFLPSPEAFGAFVVVALVLTATPGPDMVYYLSNTMASGRRAGLVALTGAATGLLVHCLFAAFGLSALLMTSEAAFGIMKIGGALWLLWMAWQMLRHGSDLTLSTNGATSPPPGRVYSQGLIINLLNPKILLFFLTFLPQFVSPGDPHAAGKLLFLGLIFILIGWTGSALIILGADRLTGMFRQNPRMLRIIDYLFAGVMGAFAVRLILQRS